MESTKFCVEFNYNECKDQDCKKKHVCAICFKDCHNAPNHKKTKKQFSDVTEREVMWFFGGWLNPSKMM